MTGTTEEDLIALISQEQRGFRRILFAGFGALLVLVAMSAGLGVYYYVVAQSLTTTSASLSVASARLEREAFDARIELDRQTNRVSNLENSVRRTYEEVRAATANTVRTSPTAVLSAVIAYLERGDLPLKDDLLVEQAARAGGGGGSAAEKALLTGAAALLVWQRSGEQITKDTDGLPASLARAEAAFEAAAADRRLATPAHTGIAWIRFIVASSTRSTYSASDCDALFSAVEAGALGANPGPQPLYWRAQCERKLGKSREALRDYALALRQNRDAAAGAGNEAALTLAMNAFHGVGTQLIATYDVPEEDLKDEISLALSSCGTSEGPGSERMRLARSCLDHAINLRKALRQTANQVSGSGENVAFSYLRERDFANAFAHASAVERTGLFPWNELVRALSAAHVDTPAARDAEREARRNVGFFDVGRFNPCELEVLLSNELFAEARRIVEEEHDGGQLACT
jgi:hypothetical protein